MCDFGFLLTPEIITYSYDHADGSPPRVEEFKQKRMSFTELSESELQEHGEHFGHFALEYEINTLKLMGATPVFYTPLDMNEGKRITLIASVLVIQILDTLNLLSRLNAINNLKDYKDVQIPAELPFDLNFTGNPSLTKRFNVNTIEAIKILEMLNHGVAPIQQLVFGLEALLNLFYPADNTLHNKILEYYRQREWKLCINFKYDGLSDLLRNLLDLEKAGVTLIDKDFFSKTLRFQGNEMLLINECLLFPNFLGKHPLEYVHRVIVPLQCKEETIRILSVLKTKPPVISFEEFL